MVRGQEIPQQLIVTCCEPTPILETTEVVFDFVAAPVDALWAPGLLFRVAPTGNDGNGPVIPDVLADFLAVIGFIGTDGHGRPGRHEHILDDLAVVNLPSGHDKLQWAALPSTAA
jgi:hypothetical protein